MPFTEGKPKAKSSIGREMHKAVNKKKPAPMVIVPREDEEFYVSKIRNLIKYMTKYKAEERILLSLAYKEICSIKGTVRILFMHMGT